MFIALCPFGTGPFGFTLVMPRIGMVIVLCPIGTGSFGMHLYDHYIVLCPIGTGPFGTHLRFLHFALLA